MQFLAGVFIVGKKIGTKKQKHFLCQEKFGVFTSLTNCILILSAWIEFVTKNNSVKLWQKPKTLLDTYIKKNEFFPYFENTACIKLPPQARDD